MVTILAGVRQAIFASLLISLVGAGFSAVSAIPAIFFPHSKLLAYFNMFWPVLADVVQGTSVLLIVWLAWLLVSLSVVYWGIVWFVEVRQSSFTRRKRSDDEVGNWKGIGREIRSDVKGSKIS